MTKALSQLVGVNLSTTGELSHIQPKHVNHLKKWYEETMKMLPKGTILIHSTTSPVWPYLSYVFKQATWAVIDLFYLMPMLVMTTGSELLGRAYKSKSININYLPAEADKGELVTPKGFSRASSSFFKEETYKGKKGIVQCSNTLLKDPSQIKYLESSIRKEVGPEFGFNLEEIHKHYAHRRQLRSDFTLLR
jgi:hypothetical protein